MTLVDRDSMPPGPRMRPGVPQGRHTHGLLAQGRAAIEEMVPGTTEDLVVQGALLRDAQAEGRWHLAGGPLAAGASALPMLLVSRPRLEWYLRQRLTARPGVDVLEQTAVLDLAFSADERRVVGVVVRDRDGSGGEGRLVAADLVVDASGRTSRTPEWLARRGYPVPDEEVRRVDKNSVTRVFRADPARRRPAAIAVAARPGLPRGGVMLAQECGRLTVTLAGCHGDRVPLTLPEFLDWARSLASTELAEAIEGLAALDDGAVYRFPANRRRGYEHLRDFPERLVVTGDALCSFDPVFGQGMTVAALEALELGRSLDEGMAGLARRFHARASVHIDTPWSLVTDAAPRPVAAYRRRLLAAAQTDRGAGRGLPADRAAGRPAGGPAASPDRAARRPRDPGRGHLTTLNSSGRQVTMSISHGRGPAAPVRPHDGPTGVPPVPHEHRAWRASRTCAGTRSAPPAG